MADNSQYRYPTDTKVIFLECTEAFQNLTNKEKLYAHHLSRASWYGSLVTLMQISPESPLIFVLIQKLCREQSLEELKAVANSVGMSDEDFQAFKVYCAGFYHNNGNYKGFGDTKIIPDVNRDHLEAFIKASKAWKVDPARMELLWNSCGDAIFSLSDREKQLGLDQKGISTYLSWNITEDDGEAIRKYLEQENMEPWNSRAFKTKANGKTCIEIRLASVEEGAESPKDFKGQQFVLTRGDYQGVLQLVCQELAKAKEHVSTEYEEKMLTHYINSFRTGSVDEHKEGSRHWVKNKGPVIETYIGFIECYRDPLGARGEFEGFVSVVNRERSKKFGTLVANAESLLPRLPWPATYEKDKFLQPDFTDLDVLTFGGSGPPAGINIPNCVLFVDDHIRQNEGFKNVTLTNVIQGSYKSSDDRDMPFLNKADKEIMKNLRIPSFEVQVGLHELLGHGSGKIFCRSKDGTYNFPHEALKDPLAGKQISSWYEEGQTFETVFGSLHSAYEECRAECVGLYLCFEEEVLKIFGYEGDAAQDLIYANWLCMVFAGAAKALEMYQPSSKSWLQAHCQARFVILRVLLEAGDDLLTVEECQDKDGRPDLMISLDRSKIATVGRTAIGDFLLKLQAYKSVADVASAKALFDKYSSVDNEGKHPFLKWREIVIAKKVPRKLIAQSNTKLTDGSVELVTYPASMDGVIDSWTERFKGETEIDHLIIDMWKKDKKHFL